ncbi:uncharacterized protein LOC133884144 [Phragmites australis]|uniref:uncharacterized protein LOC133884144 n=1 Tax=Phragmites australis TaxID=29695 RepID=UPI002D77A9F0|nr:uncharacterized protein LOC133884144 [Phragmites australis]
MESSSDSGRPASNLEKEANEGVQDLASVRRPSLLMAASSGKWQELREEILGKEKGAAVSVSLKPRQVVIDLASGEQDDDSALEVITEEADSALHVVAAAGDSPSYLKSARLIYGKARHLLATRNGKGDTPLHCAARAGNTKMVAYLIELAEGEDNGGGREKVRAFLRTQNMRGETALHEAVRFGNMDMVQALVKSDKELARVVAKDGTSPLYLASSLGHHKIADELHNADDELSYSGPDEQNALHAAALDDKKMTKLLLKWNKALVKQRDIHGSTPLHFAASAADPSLQFTLFVFTASKFERYSFFSYFLPQKCLTKFYECMNLPLAQLLKVDPSSAFQPDVHGSFPVHVAASADSMVAIIILLTKYPGCAGLRDAKGRTFLHVAVEKKRLHVVEFVCNCWRSYKSVVNVQDKNGNTALHLAIIAGDVDIFRCLVRNSDVHINLQNNEGKTPMDLAQGKVQSGFYFGMTAHRRIVGMLTFANGLTANRRRDQITEYNQSLTPEDEKTESTKITEFAQIVGIGSVLVATATFAAAFAIPGGVGGPSGTPVLAGLYAFDGFVISNTLAFMCSTLATFSLVYCGVAAVDIQSRLKLVSFALALLLCAARTFCAAFAFSLYLLLNKVERGTAIASCVMTSLALLDGLWFLLASFNDTTVLVNRRITWTVLKLGTGFLANITYLFWPYLVIFGYLSLNNQAYS